MVMVNSTISICDATDDAAAAAAAAFQSFDERYGRNNATLRYSTSLSRARCYGTMERCMKVHGGDRGGDWRFIDFIVRHGSRCPLRVAAFGAPFSFETSGGKMCDNIMEIPRGRMCLPRGQPTPPPSTIHRVHLKESINACYLLL